MCIRCKYTFTLAGAFISNVALLILLLILFLLFLYFFSIRCLLLNKKNFFHNIQYLDVVFLYFFYLHLGATVARFTAVCSLFVVSCVHFFRCSCSNVFFCSCCFDCVFSTSFLFVTCSGCLLAFAVRCICSSSGHTFYTFYVVKMCYSANRTKWYIFSNILTTVREKKATESNSKAKRVGESSTKTELKSHMYTQTIPK